MQADLAQPLVIAHRGSSGTAIEHTLRAHEMAIACGADFIELDLVPTKDGVLIVRHENELGRSTDVNVRPEFLERRTVRSIDGKNVTGWFSEDFTLAEIKTLHAREPMPDIRPKTAGSKPDNISTFDEILTLIRSQTRNSEGRIGVYFEPKHPSYFSSIGIQMDSLILDGLKQRGFSTRLDPVFIQSFEVSFLKSLREKTDMRLTQLMEDGQPFDMKAAGSPMTYADMQTAYGLANIARYADGIGPPKHHIIPILNDCSQTQPTTLIADAHEAGLFVHAWTFRSENCFLPANLRRGDNPIKHGDAETEYKQFFDLGIDGIFTDFPLQAMSVRELSS